MGKESVTPLNVLEEVIHSYSLFLYQYDEISKEHNLGVQSIFHQTRNDIQSTPGKLAHLAKKGPPIFP